MITNTQTPMFSNVGDVLNILSSYHRLPKLTEISEDAVCDYLLSYEYSKWVFVKDQLPEPLVDVLLIVDKQVVVGKHTYQDGWFYVNGTTRNDITYWQPFPQFKV